jgi:hypothetical protein
LTLPRLLPIALVAGVLLAVALLLTSQGALDSPAAVIRAEPRQFHPGKLCPGEVRHLDVTITNAGRHPLQIVGAQDC